MQGFIKIGNFKIRMENQTLEKYDNWNMHIWVYFGFCVHILSSKNTVIEKSNKALLFQHFNSVKG